MYHVRPRAAKFVPLNRQFDGLRRAMDVDDKEPADADHSDDCGEPPERGEDYQVERGALVEDAGAEDAPVEKDDGEFAGVLRPYGEEEGGEHGLLSWWRGG